MRHRMTEWLRRLDIRIAGVLNGWADRLEAVAERLRRSS